MKALAPYTNLIPVIAKSDSMTEAEAVKFNEDVAVNLAQGGIPVYQQPGDENAKKVFNIISSTTRVEPEDDFGRKYKYGTAWVNSPHHSDMPELREVVLAKCFRDLRKRTHQLYNDWSTERSWRKTLIAYLQAVRRSGWFSFTVCNISTLPHVISN